MGNDNRPSPEPIRWRLAVDAEPLDRSTETPARPRLAEGVRLHEDRHGGEVVLLYPEGVLRLNQTGRAILSLCDGRRTLDDIAATLASRFEAADGALTGDVADFLGRMSERRLVRLRPEGGIS